MISQTKHLKCLLKKHNITDDRGKLRVRVERNRCKWGVEWGDAVAHVRELTKEEIQNLVNEDKYLSIFVYRGEFGYSIIRSSGSDVRILTGR